MQIRFFKLRKYYFFNSLSLTEIMNGLKYLTLTVINIDIFLFCCWNNIILIFHCEIELISNQ